MRARAFSLIAASVAALLATSSCADTTGISGPRQAGQQSTLLGGSVDETVSTVETILVAPVHRKVALAQPVSWSFTVGSAGATSSNPATGLTIEIPSGALSRPVTIKVTALAGTAVAYRFEPHGLQFAQDVQLKQKTSLLDLGLVSSLLFQGAHFPGDEPEYIDGLAVVTETVAAQLNLLSGTLSFPIRHFSGWIIASGRSDNDSDQ